MAWDEVKEIQCPVCGDMVRPFVLDSHLLSRHNAVVHGRYRTSTDCPFCFNFVKKWSGSDYKVSHIAYYEHFQKCRLYAASLLAGRYINADS